ncbi:MAG: T9SS type A sorting domain-containing protein [Bacteroidales bacterium]
MKKIITIMAFMLLFAGLKAQVAKPIHNIDATLTTISTADYVLAGSTNISGTITNSGVNAITSFDVVYKINGGPSSAIYSVIGQNIVPKSSYKFTHEVPVNLTVGQYNVEVTISNVNGLADENPADNVLTKTVTAVLTSPTRHVFCEEETGTWCGWCVRGIVYMGQMATNYPTDWVGIAVHDSDPMTVTAWDAGTTSFTGFSGFPSIEVDRTILDDPSNAAADYTTEKAVVSPVDVELANVTYNPSTKKISFDVTATPTTTGTVSWYMNAAIYENNVTWAEDASPVADSANYEQHNHYSGGSYGAMGGFENLSDPVPAADMHFDFVSRAILGGYAGTALSIPASIVDGTTYTQNYTYTVPAYQNEAQMYAVGFVVDQASGKVLNSIQAVIPAGVHETQSSGFKMFPNPTKGVVHFSGLNGNSQITVTNLYGETLMFVENTNSIDLSNFANGIYFVNIKSNNTVVTEKIILNK